MEDRGALHLMPGAEGPPRGLTDPFLAARVRSPDSWKTACDLLIVCSGSVSRRLLPRAASPRFSALTAHRNLTISGSYGAMVGRLASRA
jgi:hypothetical protein